MQQVSINGQTLHQTTSYLVNQILIPLVKKFPTYQVIFEQWPRRELLHLVIYDGDDYQYLIELEPVLVLQGGVSLYDQMTNRNGNQYACRVHPVIPGYDFQMDYPGKGVDLQTTEEVLATVEYLLANMSTPAKIFTAVIDREEEERGL